MILTAGEREKLAIYLEQHAADNEKLAEQLIQMPAGSFMVPRYRNEAEACRVVASMLRKTVEQTKGEEEKT